MRELILFVFSASLLFGRLGENRTELVERLGAVRLESRHSVIAQGEISPLGPSLFFEKDGWRVQCDLIEGRCARITYAKKGEWTPAQITTLLENNAQGARWREDADSNKMIRKWTRPHQAAAKWEFTGNLQLVAPAYLRAKEQREEELRRKATEQPKL